MSRSPRQVAGAVARRTQRRVETAAVTAARRAFELRVKAAAARVHASIELDVAPDVVVGRGVQVTFVPGSRNRLVLGPGVVLEDRVLIRFNGGSVHLHEGVLLRRDVVFNVGGGTLTVGARGVMSWGCVVHCAERVELAEMVGLAEQVTIADTNHYFTTPDAYFWHNARTRPVTVARNTWLCPKVSVVPGARIGSHCIVTASSVVVGEVPDGSLATGVPATVRPLDLPWRAGD